MIRSLVGILTVVLTVPYISLHIGNHFQSQISTADSSATPWRRARLSYRVAKFSPFLWDAATAAEDQTDLILSDFFFSQVLRGEQDAIVPDNHLDFLTDRPDNDTWNAIRAKTLLQYGQFSDALQLAQTQNQESFASIQAVSAFFTGEQEQLQTACSEWTDCPKGWRHLLPFDPPSETNLAQSVDWQSLPEADQPIFIEWAIVNGHWTDSWTEMVSEHAYDSTWRCANLALAVELNDSDRLVQSVNQFWGEDGSEWWFSYGNLTNEVPCHPDRFAAAKDIATPELQTKLTLLQATAHTALLRISEAQSTLKTLNLDTPETTDNERTLAYHLRVLTRELAGSTKGMEKYIALGLPYNKALFSIHMGRSKLYQQAKTTAIQNLSALNGYPIPPKLQQEYTDMLMFSKRLNGSASKITIGNHALEYDFMDDDASFREWLVSYQSESMDNPNGVPMTIPLLRFWRGESKHADQLLQTHLESTIHPLSVMMFTHQRFLAASLRGEKALTSTTWKQFAKTRKWLDDVPFPQMLHTHAEWFTTPWLQ